MIRTLALLASLTWAAPSAAPAAAPALAPPTQLPPGQLGELVKLGKKLFEETGTDPRTRDYVANGLSCASCHPDAGAHPYGSTLIGVAAAYPAWSPREKAVITLEDRVLNCFMRSMNGVRPPNGSVPSLAITAYLTWLSTGTPIAMNSRAAVGPHRVPPLTIEASQANVAAGKKAFEGRCAVCHGKDGQGDPPVWGPRSFNAGAGLAHVPHLAAWIHVSMPPGDESLTEQEALDVAAYVDSQPRPDFVLADHLPRGAAPPPYNATVRDETVRAPTWPPRK